MTNELLGTWQTDPTDIAGIENYGNIKMEFTDDGQLIYSIIENERVQIIFMTYVVDGNTLITDQPSHPEENRSQFLLEGNTLELIYDELKTKYIRVIP